MPPRPLVVRVAWLLLALPGVALAQGGRGVFTGTVRDSMQRPIIGADISFPDLTLSARANDRGEFRLTGIPVGTHNVLIRSIGYGLIDDNISFTDGQTVTRQFVLKRVIILDSVVTTAAQRYPDMIDFEENRKVGLGHFITPAEMSKQEGRSMGAILEQFPAIHMIHGASGAAWVGTARGRKSIREGDCPKLEDAYRQPTDYCAYCYAQVFLDNVSLSQVEYPNISKLIPAETQAIEYYAGGGQTPTKYSVLNTQCGVVVFHSRRPP